MRGELPGGLVAQPSARQDVPIGVDDSDSVRPHQAQPPVRRALRQRWPVRTEQHEVMHRVAQLVFLGLSPESAEPARRSKTDVQQG